MGKYNKEKYYYFQLKSTFFDNDVISNLESMKNGYEMLILYFKLIFKTINKDGKLVIHKIGTPLLDDTYEDINITITKDDIEFYKKKRDEDEGRDENTKENVSINNLTFLF